MGLDLITLQEYKDYEGITSSTQDTEISTIIPKVSDLVKNICRRTFVDWVDDSKVETFNGGAVLLFSEAPVIQVQGLEYSTDYGQTYTNLVEFKDWAVDYFNQQIVPIGVSEFTYRLNGYRLTYTAGYEAIPQDLKLAVLDLVTYYMKNQGAVHSVAVVGAGNAQVQYLTQTNLPTHIKRVLDLYVLNYN